MVAKWKQELKLFYEMKLISNLGLVMKLTYQFQILNSNSSSDILKIVSAVTIELFIFLSNRLG